MGPQLYSSGRSDAVVEPRTVCRYPSSCYAALFIEDDVYAARVDNLSAEGVAFVLKEPLPGGATGRAKLFTLSGASSCACQLHVVHSTPWSDGNYLVGCRFAEELSWERLRDLVS